MTHSFYQNYDEITITLPNIKSNTKVSIKNKNIKVTSGDDILLDKTFMYDVKEDQMIWCIDDNVLTIELAKEKEQWWDMCFVGDEKIDTEELAKSRPINMNNLDDEAKRMIEKMMCKEQENVTKQSEMNKKIMEMNEEMMKRNNEK